MAGLLEEKVAFITGGGSGIGAATAMVFAREGARVVVVDVAEDGGERTVSEIGQAGGEALFVRADVTDEVEIAAAIKQTVDRFGRLDCAFNNAGILGETKPITEYSREGWDRVIAVNLTGVWLCVQQEIRQMVLNGGGSIVNTASVAGLQGSAMIPAYSVSKHGVVGLTKAAAKGYGAQGIRVNAVCPSLIETPLAAPLLDDPAYSEPSLARYTMGRFGRPSEVAEAVAWLSSDAASFVTGVAMPVDSGFMA